MSTAQLESTNRFPSIVTLSSALTGVPGGHGPMDTSPWTTVAVALTTTAPGVISLGPPSNPPKMAHVLISDVSPSPKIGSSEGHTSC